MEAAGLVSAGDRDVAERAPLVLRREHPDLRAPHFVAHVLGGLAPAVRAGATVETTLDTPLQGRLEIAVRDHLEAVGGRDISQAGVVVLRNRDGAVLAMVGSADYFDAAHAGAVNVTTIHRRPGSTLKPFVYGLALEAGDSAATLAYDVVLAGEGHESYTADVKQHGVARYREALAGSYNLAAVHTLRRVGVPTLVQRLRDAGLTTLGKPDDAYGPSLAIGDTEIRLIEYAAAFAAFGNGGRAVVPRAVTRLRFPDGGTFNVPPAEGRAVFAPEIAYLVFDMLSDPDARRPMFGSTAPTDVGFKIALKTGTTRGYTDDLAFGTTREYTVGAWAGNFDGSPTAGVMAMQGAAPLVRAAFVALAARFGTPAAPEEPPGLEHGDVCALSGMLPGPDCPHKRETFVPGTAPRAVCDWHRRVDGRPQIAWPPEVAGWARIHRGARRATGAGLAPAVARPAVATAGGPAAPLEIVYPPAGAHFLLDPGRPRAQQRPPLRAIPAGALVRWTVDGHPADSWVPAPGRHMIEAALGTAHREEEIDFE
jgi:penicillin-binding protein 1C